ncbi:MAG TPA: hypothetical protein PK919_01185 [Candidatus Aminicenantes bacterium]|nr:hypothetical protein [Candidatus Aminicenantes bacterium]
MAAQGHRPDRRRRRWPLVFLLALATVSLLLHATEILRRREIAGLARRHAAQVRERPIAAAKDRRARYYMGRFFLGYPRAASFAAADLARRLETAARPLRLLSIQVEPGLHELAFELAVDPGARVPRAARRRIDALIGRLKRIPWLLQAEPAAEAASGAGVFVVSGLAEMP